MLNSSQFTRLLEERNEVQTEINKIMNQVYFKFGENRHKNLSLSNKCIIKNGNQEGYKFALLDPELTSRCQFAFKMLQGDFKWTALGVCDYQKIKENNFEITDFKIGHGLFVVINNGGTLSSNDQDYNNKFMSPFQFKQGDIIICTYDPEYCDIEFKKYSTQEKLKLRLKKCVRDPLRICVLFKGGNQDEIQYIEKIDHLQYYTDTQTLSRLKKKRLIDELIESSEHSFSPNLKHRNLKITNKCTIKSEGPNGYKFGLLEKPLTGKKKWAFKMLEGTFKWVAIGICHIQTIKEKNFIFEPMNIGHGAYMISQNAGTWSNIQSEFNNQVKAFKFGLGYIIIVEYDPENNLLSFYNERNPKESYSLKIKQEENNPFHICVVTHFNSDEIQYIDSVDQIPHFKEQVYYQWQWNSRLYGENPNLQEWTNYDYLDNQKLNDYYAKNKKDCRVGEFFVEFKAMIQYSVKDINKQRKVRKIQVEKEEEEEFQNEIKDNIWTVGEKTVNLYTQTGVHIFSTEKQNLRPFSLSNQLKITNKEIQKADLLLYEEICKFIESKSTYLETKPHLFLDKLKQNQIYNEFDTQQNMINQQMSYHFVLPNYNICFDIKNNLYYVQHYFQMAYMLPLVTVIQNSFNSFKNNKLHQQIETNYVEYGQNCEIEVFKFNVLQMILKLQKYKYYFQGEKSTSQIQAYRKLLQEKVIEYNYSVATGEKTFSLISKTQSLRQNYFVHYSSLNQEILLSNNLNNEQNQNKNKNKKKEEKIYYSDFSVVEPVGRLLICDVQVFFDQAKFQQQEQEKIQEELEMQHSVADERVSIKSQYAIKFGSQQKKSNQSGNLINFQKQFDKHKQMNFENLVQNQAIKLDRIEDNWKVKYCLNHIQSYIYQIENGQGEFVEYADKFLDKSYPTNTHEKKQIMQVGRKTMHLLLLLVMYQAGVLQGELMKFQLDNFIARSGVFMELFNNILRYIQGYRVVLEIQGIKQQMKEQQKEEDEIIQEIQNVIINEDDYTKLDQMCDCLGLQYKQQDSQRKKIELLQQCIKILENRKIDNQMDVYEFTDEPITYSPDDNDLINEKPAIITKDPNSCVDDNMNSEDQFLTPIKQKSISMSGEKREKNENISNNNKNQNKNENEQDLQGDSLNKLRESVDQAKQLMRERQEMNWELKQIIREIIGFLGNRVVEPESLMAQYENRIIWTNQLYELLMVDQDNFLKNYYNFTNQLLTHQQYQRDGFIEIFLGNKQLKQQLINKLSSQLKDQINKFTYTSSLIFHQIPKYQQVKKQEILEKSPEKISRQKSGEKSERGENKLKFEYEDEVNLEIGEDDEELLGLEEIMLKYFGGIGENYGGQMDFLARGGVRDKKIIQQEFQQKLNKKKRKLSKEIKNKIQIDLEREINNKKIQEKVEEIVNNVNNIIHVLGSQWLWKNSQFQEYLNQQFVPFFNQLLKLNDIFDQYQINSISSLGNILVQQVLYCVLKLDNEYILQQEILDILNKQLEQEIGRNGDEINLQDLAEKKPSSQQLKQLYFNTQQQYQMKNYHFVKIYRIQFILTLIQDIIKGQKYQKEQQKEKGEILESVNREQQQHQQQQQFQKDEQQNQSEYKEFYSIKKKQMLQLSSNLVYLIQYSKIPALVKISSRILKQIIENLGDFSQVLVPLIQQDNKITFQIQNEKLNITDLFTQQLGNIQLGLDIKYSVLDPQRFLEQFNGVENFKEKEEEQKEESKLGEKSIKIEKQNQNKKYSVSVRLKEDQQEEAILAIFQIFYYWNIMNPMDEKDQVPRDFTSELDYIQNSNQSATEILSKFGKTLKCGECNGELQKTNGPYMQQFVSWSCNVCNKGFKFNDGNMNCQKCQYDICFDCYDKENEQILMSDITVLLKMKFNRLQMFNDFDDDDGIDKKTIENNFIILMQNLIFEIDQIIGAHQKRIQDQIKMFGKPSENCKNTFILKSGLNLQQAKEFAQLVELSAQRKLQNINLKYFFSQEEQITRLHPFNLAKEEVILRKRGQKQQKEESAQADDKNNNDKNNKSGKKNQEEENENVKKLMEFGFTENQVKWALLDSKNNLEIAANNLLAGLYENMIDANPFPKENWMGSPDSKKSGGNSSSKKSSSQRKKSHKYSDSLEESEVQEFNENFVEKMMENELQVDIILSGDEIINELLMGEDKIQIPLYNQNLYQSGESMTYISLNLIGLIREIISKNEDQQKNFEQNLEQCLNILEKQDSLFFLNLNLSSISRLIGGLTVITGIQQKKLNFEPVKLKDFNENQEKNYFLYQQNPGSRNCDIISSKTNEIIFESVPQELVQSWGKLKKIDNLEQKIGGKIQKMAQMLLQNKNLQNKEKKQYMKYQEQLQNQMETKLQQQSQKRGEIKNFETILELQVVKKILENDCFVLKNMNALILDKILAYLSLENCGKNVYEQNFLSMLEELADEQILRGSNYIEDFSEQDLTVGWENLISNQNFEPNFIFLKEMSKYGVCLNQQIEEFLKKEDKLQLQQIKQKQFNSLKEKGHNFPSISTNMTSYSRQESNFISSLPQPQLPLQNKNLVYWEKQFKIWKMFREEFDRMRLKNSIIYDDKVQIINILYEIFTNDRNPGRKSFYEKRVELQRHMKPSSYDQEFLDKVFTYNESEKQYEEFYAQENLEAGKIYLIKSKRFDNQKKLLCTVPSQKYVPVVILWIESNQALVQYVDEYNSTFGFFWVDIKNSFKKTILPIKQEIPQFYLQSNFQHQFTNLLSNSLSLKAKRLLVKYYTAFDEKYNSQIQIQDQNQNQNQNQLKDNLQENDENEQIIMNSDFLYVDKFEKYFNEKNNTDLLPLILEWVMEHEIKGEQIEGWIKALDSQIIPDLNKLKQYQLYNINQQERDLKYGNLKTFERLFYKLVNSKNFDINPQNNLLIKLINMAQKDLQRMINFVIKNQITLDLLKVEREDNINQFPQFEETQINSLIFTFTSQSHMPLTSKINFYSDKNDDSKLTEYKHVGLDKEQHFISPIIVKGREIYCQFYLNQGELPITFEAAKVERGNLDCLVFGVPEKWNSVCWLIDSISSAFTQNFNNFNSLKGEKIYEKSGLLLKEMQKLNRFLSQQMLELSRGPNYLKQQISWLITRVTRKIQYIVFQSQQDLGDLKKQHFAIIGVEEKSLFRILEEVKQIEQQEQREFKLPSAYNQNLIEMCSTILSPLSQKISKKIFSYTHRDIVIDKLPEFLENMVNVQNIYKFLDKQGILTNQLYQQTVDSQSQWSNMICINNLPQDKSVNEMRQLIISMLKKSRRRIINEELDIIIPSLKDLVTHEGVCFIITDGSYARVEEESKTEDEKEEDMFNELYMDGTQCQNCNLQMINTCSSCDELVQSILKNLPNASLCFGRSIIQNQNFNKYLSSILRNRLLKIKQQDEKYLKFLPNIKSDQLNDKVLKALQKSYQNIKISEELQAHVKRSYSALNIQNINSFIQSFQNIVQAGNALNAFQILSDFGFNLWLNEGTYAINEAPKTLPQSQIEQMLQKCQNIRFLYDNTQMDQKDARFTKNLLRVLSINLEKCFPYISISKENNRFISVFSKENEQFDFIELQISNYLEKYRQLLIRTTKLEMQQKVLNKTAIKDLNGFTLNLPYVYIDKNKNLPQFIQAYYSLLNIPRNQFMPIKSADKGVPFVCFEIISQTTAQGAGGLFRQFFNDVSLELKNDRKGPGQDYVPLLVQHNEKKEEYMINKKANSPFNLQLFEFLGVLMGCSIRTNTPLSINLPMIFWKLLVEEDISQQDWIEYRLKTESGEFERIFDEDMINQIKEAGEETFSDQYFERQVQKINQMRNKFIINNLNNENQDKIAQIQKELGKFSASFENLDEIIPNYCKSLLYDIVFQMKYLKRGLNSVVPYPLLKITSAKDLEIMVCGVYTIDIDLLKKNTVYEGMDTDGKKLNENSKRIKMLWEALESDKYFSIEDKRKFIQFCYAVDRLPMTDQEYKQQGIVFKISANTSKKALNDPDNCFISAQTCFFQLKLPDYTGIEALVKQIKLSIQGAGNELSEKLDSQKVGQLYEIGVLTNNLYGGLIKVYTPNVSGSLKKILLNQIDKDKEKVDEILTNLQSQNNEQEQDEKIKINDQETSTIHDENFCGGIYMFNYLFDFEYQSLKSEIADKKLKFQNFQEQDIISFIAYAIQFVNFYKLQFKQHSYYGGININSVFYKKENTALFKFFGPLFISGGSNFEQAKKNVGFKIQQINDYYLSPEEINYILNPY
ncbi:UBA-like protein [Pseudocohnilembus persalinus]|uniref:UBA-like protein n=1 Tax=Pseudocohnilembus persalinus TaxID=266149 RepID=A0A0V0QGL1_PSEPJ|nr:UBA-like protein [Pseudocohnilembus persalinus]|eukprot:KRX01327.1 UBA-like protein [Pseudocohnilembus persalinus]